MSVSRGRSDTPSAASGTPAKSAIVGARSTLETSALDTEPSGMMPGNDITIGTLIDSS